MSQEPDRLYQAIGGEQGIELLVGKFYDRVLRDPKLASFFTHAPMDRLKMMQKEFFSEALGGPLFYSGHSLRQVHAGKGIRRDHLRKFVKHLLATLEEDVPELNLSRQDIDAIYSRIAIEADRITNSVGDSA
ncbi:group I truncated hemoglobin [Haloferula sargassicola]|uniref:Group 1 truncated hemoglobin GlbN n=1 Tax=Haloferula sargassicola TaxID=490096 RepID=A0ABP9UN55_9BACT